MLSDNQLPPEVAAVLRDEGLETQTPFTRRIFTNRDLNFEDVPVVGFDMDYTLARYDQSALEQLSIEVTVRKLLTRGYPEILESTRGDPNFAICGLVVDRELGNILKMDRHGYVGRVYHGRNELPRNERKRIYRAQRIGQKRERFAFVDTGFSLPEVTLFARLVELIDTSPELWTVKGRGAPSYAQAWNDVRTAMDESHQDDSLKSIIQANPARFFRKDPDLAATLHKLRSAGKKLFLLTNSFYTYSNVVMSHILDSEIPAYEDWTVYFDWIVVGARKPSFFTDEKLFQELDRQGAKIGRPKEVPQRGKIYEGGSRAGLQSALGVEPDEVLYVGDHIYGDVVQSKKSSGWRTVLVVEDIEHDLAVRSDYDAAIQEIQTLSGLRDQLTEEIAVQRQIQRALSRVDSADIAKAQAWLDDDARAKSVLEQATMNSRKRFERLRNHEAETYEALQRRSHEVDSAFNPYWGSIFAERQDSSMYGAQLEAYACLYTSRVSNFLFVSPSHYFHAPHGSMPHWQKMR